MVLESPIWLLGLLPWIATVIYMLPGKGRARAVPYLAFWKQVSITSRRTAFRLPPISVGLILIALMLALLAAAKPARQLQGPSEFNGSSAQQKTSENYVAITAMSVRLVPHPQVMVRLENHSDRKIAVLKVEDVRREVQLPASGQSVDEFLDIEHIGASITAEIDSGTGENSKSKFSIVRNTSGIRIVIDRSLPKAVQRIATVYSMDRPGGIDADDIVISSQRINSNQAGIWVGGEPTANQQATRPDVLTRGIKSWPSAVFVFLQEKPARQIWISGDFGEWDKTTDFVVFFANAFDWLGRGTQQYLPAAPPAMQQPVSTLLKPILHEQAWAGELLLAALGCVITAVFFSAQIGR